MNPKDLDSQYLEDVLRNNLERLFKGRNYRYDCTKWTICGVRVSINDHTCIDEGGNPMGGCTSIKIILELERFTPKTNKRVTTEEELYI